MTVGVGDALDWQRDGRDWPHHESSRFVGAGGLRWHVQQMGRGPVLLLLHGTGASTHSWRDLMPLLAERFTVVAPDLPGHAFTATPASAQCSLPGMARLVSALCGVLGVQPALVVGHSAGAAVAVRMALDGLLTPEAIVSINGALLPWQGWAGWAFAPAAKLLALNPLVPRLFAWRARDPAAVQRLIDGTGSRLDAAGVAMYARLLRDSRHVAGALEMMANWKLETLAADLPRLTVPLRLLVGARDGTVPPAQARLVAAQVHDAELLELSGLGHLAHEEQPQQVAQFILQRW